MASGKSLTVSVVSAVAQVWEGTAEAVVARTTEGEIGILPGREPILAVLGDGEVRITTDTEVVKADASDGFLSVSNDVVTVVARQASLSKGA